MGSSQRGKPEGLKDLEQHETASVPDEDQESLSERWQLTDDEDGISKTHTNDNNHEDNNDDNRSGAATDDHIPQQYYTKLRDKFIKAGYSPNYIDQIYYGPPEKPDIQANQGQDTDAGRPTYIRVRTKHLLPETLDNYGLPWEYDSEKEGYLIIKKFISHDLQEELFRHTKNLLKTSQQQRQSDMESSMQSDGAYMPAKDADSGDVLTWEISIANTDTFTKPDLGTRRTTDILKGDEHLKSRLPHLKGLLKASIMSAHESHETDISTGAALEYYDSPKCLPDSHFKWIHAHTSDFSSPQYQFFLSRLPELDKEEQALTIALLNDLDTVASPGAPPLFRARRVDARRKQDDTGPTKWAALIITSYLSKTSSMNNGQPVAPFFAYQYPLEPIEAMSQLCRLQSLRQMSPIHDLSIEFLVTFLTSSGILVTFGPESFTTMCQPPLSATILSFRHIAPAPRKVQLHDPDGAIFHFPLELCETYFDLVRAVVTVCKANYSDNLDDYIVLDQKGLQIKSMNWLQYCNAQKSPRVDVRVRIMSETPQPKKREQKGIEAQPGLQMSTKASGLNADSSRLKPEVGPEIEVGPSMIKTDDSATALTVYPPIGTGTDSGTGSHANAALKLALSRSQNGRVVDVRLPPNRIPRFLVQPSSGIITNLLTHESDQEDSLFERPRRPQPDGINLTPSTESPAKNSNIYTVEASTEPAPKESARVQTRPFFLWPTKDTDLEPPISRIPEPQHDLDSVLNEIHSFLSRGYLEKQDNDESQKRLAGLYLYFPIPDDYEKTNGLIIKDLQTHEPLDMAQNASVDSSWQHQLHEITLLLDSILASFCRPDYDHTVTRKFGHIRAAFFKTIKELCNQQFAYNSSAALEDFPETDSVETSYHVFDCTQNMDKRLPVPLPVDDTLEGCVRCQPSEERWPRFTSRKAALAHLRQQHFGSTKVSSRDLQRYIVPSRCLDSIIICEEMRRLLSRILDHLREAAKIIVEVQDGVTGSTTTKFRYRLTKSLVKAFRHFMSLMINAAEIAFRAKRTFDDKTDSTTWTQLRLRNEIDRFAHTGAALEFALSAAKNHIVMQSHANDYSTTVSYEVVDSPYILLTLLDVLTWRCGGDSSGGQSLLQEYSDRTDTLRESMRRRPGKRVNNDIVRLTDEIKAIQRFMADQDQNTMSVLEILKPESFAVTTTHRKRQNAFEQRKGDEITGRRKAIIEAFSDLNADLSRLQAQNVRAADLQKEDHGKAILVLTIVTVIFLPLSFVTSFLGMNTHDIRNMGSSQWLFWVCALPLTTLTMVGVVMGSYLGEQIREILLQAGGRLYPNSRRAPRIQRSHKYGLKTRSDTQSLRTK